MALRLLTKTDFKLARGCATKLYYLKRAYPSAADSNEYLEFLKEGGHIIGEMARIVHPEGEYIGLAHGIEEAKRRTAEALERENVTLFEGVFESSGMFAAVDILEKRGEHLSIIEVKSKSFDSTVEDEIVGKKGVVRSEWQEHIDDIAFQTFVVRSSRPELSVTPYLLLPDKSKKSELDGLASMFTVERHEEATIERYRVKFIGDQEELRRGHFLTRVNVAEPVKCVMPLVQQEARRFVNLILPELSRAPHNIGKHCKECEYNTGGAESGYRECWGELADVSPHVFDLNYGGLLKEGGKYLLDLLISRGKVSLFDIPEAAIKGKRGERQAIQIRCTREGREWINPVFRNFLSTVQYPLHFIDFETSTSAVPYHRGMRPYEQIAFQWSCHTIPAAGAAPEHSEWINVEDSFPSFKFAESLRAALAEEGTIFMWADHENRVLKDIRRQAREYRYERADELTAWLDSMVNEEGARGRLVDMNSLCIENYFHPEMKGKTSIKYVLPAVWNNNEYLWAIPYFQEHFARDGSGGILSPYDVLPGISIEGASRVVRGGTGAMTAYQEMMYGLSRGDAAVRERWSKLLLQYCRLDTTAMVIVWTHWNRLTGV